MQFLFLCFSSSSAAFAVFVLIFFFYSLFMPIGISKGNVPAHRTRAVCGVRVEPVVM
jgi:hypothetical protein